MYLLSFYVPETHLETVKTALFSAGAGTFGEYQHCAWQTLGQGQFMPLANSNPFLGEPNHLEKVIEYKVEMVCPIQCLIATLAALKKSHPYETPAYHLIQLDNQNF